MTRELDVQERFRRAVSRLVPDSMDALEAAIQEEFDKFLATAPSTEPTGEGRRSWLAPMTTSRCICAHLWADHVTTCASCDECAFPAALAATVPKEEPRE